MEKTLNSKIKRSSNEKVFRFVLYLISILMLLIIVYPLYFVVIASFSDPSAVGSGQVWLLPKGFSWDGYKELLKHDEIWIGYKNTVIYTVLGTAFGLFINITAAYVLSRKDLAGRKFLSFMFIFTMFFSGGLIPTFLTIKDFHLYNKYSVMIIPFAVNIYNIIVARTFFQNSIPPDLNDAAKIDGCSNLHYFFKIVLPLSKAIIAVIGLWTAVGLWNSYFNALVYLPDSAKHPLQLVMRNILIRNDMQMALGSGEAAQIALRLSGLMRYSMIIISTVPIMCIYPFIQKYFNKGVMIGAVKG